MSLVALVAYSILKMSLHYAKSLGDNIGFWTEIRKTAYKIILDWEDLRDYTNVSDWIVFFIGCTMLYLILFTIFIAHATYIYFEIKKDKNWELDYKVENIVENDTLISLFSNFTKRCMKFHTMIILKREEEEEIK